MLNPVKNVLVNHARSFFHLIQQFMASIFVHLQSKFYSQLSYNEIIIGRFKNDKGTENWPERENSILFFRHPFGEENFLFGDYFIDSHILFP